MLGRRGQGVFLILLSVLVAAAADTAWNSKAINQWTQQDAQQVLADSPWAKTSAGMVSRLETEDERREGGKMGQDHGVGFDGVDDKDSTPTFGQTMRGKVDPRRSSHPISLRLRWESALPIRAAEIKTGAPTIEGEAYSISVYGVPGSFFGKDPKVLGNPLKNEAALRRDGKKDIRPSSVEVFSREDGLVIVYHFPLSAEIAAKDGYVDFAARIGRIAVLQRFQVDEMQFQGKLEL